MTDQGYADDPRRGPPAPGHTPTAARPLALWFLGDLDDPWVIDLAESLPPSGQTRRVHCPGDLPEEPFGPIAVPDVVVIHRAILTQHDAQALARWRERFGVSPRWILCFGPHIRAADLERWTALVDLMLPEATAAGALARSLAAPDAELAPRDRRAEPLARTFRPRVAVVSTNYELRAMLAEAITSAGYTVAEARDWSDAPPSGPAVWDVPVLEPSWAEALARRAKVAPVVALMGFADRRLVAEAREHGAVACLDLPFDLADLTASLERLVPAGPVHRVELPHAVPPPPNVRRRLDAPAPLADWRGST